MNEREGFLKLIAENEDDTTTRLVYADWLDDHGEHEEADHQRKWVAAKEWLVNFCAANNPPPDRADTYGTIVSYESLIAYAQTAIESENHERLWFECRNNRAMCNALRVNEEEFWKNASLVTGAQPATPNPYDDDYGSACPNC